ncbi:MAG: aconitate hydratase [Actinomycetota bacterium]
MRDPRSLTHRILFEHLLEGELRPSEGLHLRPDQVLIEDATGTMTYLQFEGLKVERVAVPLAVMYVDHNVLQVDERNMDEHRFLQALSARYGIKYSRPGNGISHSIHLERFARPGGLLFGADSHTTMAGAMGMFALGGGGLDVAIALAGHGLWISCPSVVAVELRGRLPEWVEAKDVVLELLRRNGVRGGNGKAFEFIGEGVETLSVMERGTICNMALETGATTAIFPSDERTREWLASQGREDDFAPLSADPGAVYDEVEVIDLWQLEPLIAKPRSPGNVVPVRDVEGARVAQVCVGSSVNSSYEDLARVAAILRDGVVHPEVEMTVSPGSRQILDAIARSDVYRDLVASGARVLEAVCGPCIGIGQAPSAGVVSVRTFNRNFPGRSGTPGDEVYLCSPSVAAATALRGRITDPRWLGEAPRIHRGSYNPEVVDRHILDPPEPNESEHIEVSRGTNIVPPPKPQPVPSRVEGRILIVLGDDISTGDMAPDGALGMSLWSNIPECATYMFRRIDPEFHDRAVSWEGGIIVAGDNYGQGSSREQAALAALHLGVRAVVAKSFARIHRQNLIAQGIFPLAFARPEDHDAARMGDTWIIEHAREGIASGSGSFRCRSGSGSTLDLRADLLARERKLLLAGGALRYLTSS